MSRRMNEPIKRNLVLGIRRSALHLCRKVISIRKVGEMSGQCPGRIYLVKSKVDDSDRFEKIQMTFLDGTSARQRNGQKTAKFASISTCGSICAKFVLKQSDVKIDHARYYETM